MASATQAPSQESSHFSRRGSNSSTHHQLPPSSDISQTSACSDSSNLHQIKRLRLNSVRAAAREVTCSFIACFSPRGSKAATGAVRRVDLYQFRNYSFSTKESKENNNNSFKNHKYSGSYHSQDAYLGTTEFSIAEICKATRNFSVANKIGEGGFGTVYKGMLKDGFLVAVKRAKKDKHDKQLPVLFKNEIQTLSKVEHLNLVRFLGYIERDDEKIIVVEYVGNGTLREHLDGSRGDVLELANRLDIAIDVAHAVTYLHMYTDHPIIHRDIKASNILLTENLRAKVADFGFARFNTEDPDATHVSTQVKGTAGYLDPEYLRTYHLTEKSDVYSFGVLLIELMTGRHPIEPKRELKERVTTRWAMQKLREGEAVLAMDPRLRRNPAANLAVEKVLELAKECLAQSRRSRPSMKRCGEVLWEIRRDYRQTEFSTLPSSLSSSRRSGSLSVGD